MYVCGVVGWLLVATKAFTSLGVKKSAPIKCVDLCARVYVVLHALCLGE